MYSVSFSSPAHCLKLILGRPSNVDFPPKNLSILTSLPLSAALLLKVRRPQRRAGSGTEGRDGSDEGDEAEED
jgi:hypothetical protein